MACPQYLPPFESTGPVASPSPSQQLVCGSVGLLPDHFLSCTLLFLHLPTGLHGYKLSIPDQSLYLSSSSSNPLEPRSSSSPLGPVTALVHGKPSVLISGLFSQPLATAL